MKPWNPPRSNALRFGARRWTDVGAYLRETAPHRRMPAGAKAGLVFVAMACICIGILGYQAFGPRDIVAKEAMAEVVTPQS
jgi:hypothetical protein